MIQDKVRCQIADPANGVKDRPGCGNRGPV